MEGVAVVTDEGNAIDLIKRMLDDDRIIRVLEYARRNNLEDDNQVFFFMALFETAARVFDKICQQTDQLSIDLKQAEQDADIMHKRYFSVAQKQMDNVRRMVEHGDRVLGQQNALLARMEVKIEDATRHLNTFQMRVEKTRTAWEKVDSNLDNKAAYTLTHERFERWFEHHSYQFANHTSSAITDLVDRKLWIAYWVGGTLAAVNLMLVIILLFKFRV